MFVDEVKAEEQGLRCAMGVFLADLDEKLRDEIVAVLDDPERSASAITRVFVSRGYEVTGRVIERHRARSRGTGCQCPS